MPTWASVRSMALFLLASVLSVPFLFWELQPGQPLLNRTLAVTIFMATLWITEAVPMGIASMMPLVLFPILRICSADEVATWYWNDTVFLFMSSSLIAGAMEKWRLHQRIALRLLTLVGSQPHLLLVGFMGITASISSILSNSATCVMMTPLAVSVVKNMSSKELTEVGNSDTDGLVRADALAVQEGDSDESRRRFRCGILLGVAYSASIGGSATLIGTGTNLVFIRVFYNLFPNAPTISFLQWLMFAGPLALVFLACTFALLYFTLCREGIQKGSVRFDTTHLRGQYAALGSITAEEGLVSVAIVALVVMWFAQEWIVEHVGADYGTLGVFFMLLLYCCPAPSHHGKTLLEWDEFGKQVPWTVILLLGGGFSLAKAFEVSGLSFWIGLKLQIFGHVPAVVLVIVLCGIITFLTELTSNAATATILLPIISALAVGMGQNPLLFMIPATLACSNAFMLPVATPPNAIVFASGSIRIREMMTAGFGLNLIGVVLNTAGILIAAPIFGIRLGHLPDWAVGH